MILHTLFRIIELHCGLSEDARFPSKLETEPSRIIKLRFLKHMLVIVLVLGVPIILRINRRLIYNILKH